MIWNKRLCFKDVSEAWNNYGACRILSISVPVSRFLNKVTLRGSTDVRIGTETVPRDRRIAMILRETFKSTSHEIPLFQFFGSL